MGFAENRYLIQGPIFTFLLLFYNYFIISSLAYILEFKITMEAMSITLYIGKIREKLRKINKFIFRSKKRKKKSDCI